MIEPQNGASLLQTSSTNWKDEQLVLCKWGEQWVVWHMDRRGHCYWGHYFQDLTEASQYYDQRLAVLTDITETEI